VTEETGGETRRDTIEKAGSLGSVPENSWVKKKGYRKKNSEKTRARFTGWYIPGEGE